MKNRVYESIVYTTKRIMGKVNSEMTVQENVEAILMDYFPDADCKTEAKELLEGYSVVYQNTAIKTKDYGEMTQDELEKAYNARIRTFNLVYDMAVEKGIDVYGFERADEISSATVENIKELDSQYDILVAIVAPTAFDNEESAQLLDENAPIMEDIDYDQGVYFALAVYILIKQGEIKGCCEKAENPQNTTRSIGGVLAAIVRAIKAKLEGIKNKISWEAVKKTLIDIFKVLIFFLIAWGCGMLIILLFGIDVLILFGKLIIVEWIFSFAALVYNWIRNGGAAEFFKYVWEQIKELAATAKEKMVKAGQKVRSWFNEFVTWIKDKIKTVRCLIEADDIEDDNIEDDNYDYDETPVFS